MLAPALAHADQISPDRPGIGPASDVVPQFTWQGEVGTDTHEVRFGLLPGFELDRDDTSWGAKLALVKNAKFKAALKLSYDNDLKTVVDLPTNTTINKWAPPKTSGQLARDLIH